MLKSLIIQIIIGNGQPNTLIKSESVQEKRHVILEYWQKVSFLTFFNGKIYAQG